MSSLIGNFAECCFSSAEYHNEWDDRYLTTITSLSLSYYNYVHLWSIMAQFNFAFQLLPPEDFPTYT
jgi:hypothetical protein